MDDPVIMVSGTMKNILQPVPQRILSISVFGSVNMQTKVNTQQQVAGIAKLVSFVIPHKEREKNENKRIFKQPVVHIRSTGKSADPNQ